MSVGKIPYSKSAKGDLPYGYYICGATIDMLNYMKTITLASGITFADTVIGGMGLKICQEILTTEVMLMAGLKLWETPYWVPDDDDGHTTGRNFINYIYLQTSEFQSYLAGSSERLESLAGTSLLTTTQELTILYKFMTTLILHLNAMQPAYMSGISGLEFKIHAALAVGTGIGMNLNVFLGNMKVDLASGGPVPLVDSEVMSGTVNADPYLNDFVNGQWVTIPFANQVAASTQVWNFVAGVMVTGVTATGILPIIELLRDNPDQRP